MTTRMAQRMISGGQRGAIVLALLLLAGQAALFIHQAGHLANPSYQNCVTCLSLHVDEVLAARPAPPTDSIRRHESPDPFIALSPQRHCRGESRIRSPPRIV